MKPLDLRSVVALAMMTAATGVASCHRADSIILVEVSGDLKLMPSAFAVVVMPARTSAHDIRVAPAAGGVITLPASFTIQLPGDMTGPLTVAVQALDATEAVMAQGAATQQLLHVGGQTILPVTIVATGNIAVTTPDAGRPVDAHPAADAQPPTDANPRADAHPVVDAGRDATALDATLDAVADGAVHPDAAAIRDGAGQS